MTVIAELKALDWVIAELKALDWVIDITDGQHYFLLCALMDSQYNNTVKTIV